MTNDNGNKTNDKVDGLKRNRSSFFLTQLTQVLSDTAATENLVQSLTKKDEATGQTYLQIPVENEAIVKNAVTLLAGLLRGMKG